jgi:hypothetical protein
MEQDVATHKCTSTSYRVHNLQPNTAYNFRIAGEAGATGRGNFGQIVCFSTLPPPTPPPTDVLCHVQPFLGPSYEHRSGGKAALCLAVSWSSTSAATRFAVQCIAASRHKLATEVRGCCAVLRGAKAGNVYEVRVRALGESAASHSAWSTPAKVRTLLHFKSPASDSSSAPSPAPCRPHPSSCGLSAPSPSLSPLSPAVSHAPSTDLCPASPLPLRNRHCSGLAEDALGTPLKATLPPTARQAPGVRRRRVWRGFRRRATQYVGVISIAGLFLALCIAFLWDALAVRGMVAS